MPNQPNDIEFYHAVVLLEHNRNGKLWVKNNLAGEKVFQGKEQPSEHEVEVQITNDPNQWNLVDFNRHFIEFC